MPPTATHDFKTDALQYGARIDFYRGQDSDDLANKTWAKMFQDLPQYREMVQQRPTSTNSCGNAMEQAVGVAYAAASDCANVTNGYIGLDERQHNCEQLRSLERSLARIRGARNQGNAPRSLRRCLRQSSSRTW